MVSEVTPLVSTKKPSKGEREYVHKVILRVFIERERERKVDTHTGK